MSKKGENIYKRKDGRWEGRYIRYYDNSMKPKFGYVYGRTYAETKQRLTEMKVGMISNIGHENYVQTCTYNVLLDKWLALSQTRVKESTYACYKRIINTHIRPHLGNYSVCELTTFTIEQFISQKKECGSLNNKSALSSKTVSDILVIVKSTIEYAKSHNYTVNCNINKLFIKHSQKEICVLSKKEQQQLVTTLLENMDLYKFGVMLSLFTGIRIGELCALQWQDFSANGNVLKVQKTLQRVQTTEVLAETKTKIIITEPKSQFSKREIPIPVFLLKYIAEFRNNPLSYILTGDQFRYIEPRTMQNHFKNYLTQSGICPVGFHTLRHTFATRCVEAGFEIKSLSEILGHSNVNITLNRYVHSSFELKIKNMNKLTMDF